MCSARPSFAPSVWAIVSVTSVGVAQGGEPDPEDARLVLRHDCGSRLEREPGLARAPRPCQRHESSFLLDQGEYRFELPLPADE